MKKNAYVAVAGVANPHGSVDTQMCRLNRQHWSVARLIRLAADLPVYELPIMAMNLADVLENNMRVRDFLGHMTAVLNADLDCPIILDEDGEIMDGRHRLIKAMHEGHATIKAVRFETNPSPCKIDEDE